MSISAPRQEGGHRWQDLLAGAVTDPVELLAALDLPPGAAPSLFSAEAGLDFPLRVPRGYVARMRKGDPDDPLLRQVLPIARELIEAPGFVPDPLGERHASPLPGLLHKYSGRALLLVTGTCAIHCRYCFRRHFPYQEHRQNWDQAVAYVAGDDTLEEVILSGGDPLAVPNQVLAALTERLASVAHLRRLRVHSRLPIVLPERVDDGLCEWAVASRLKTVLVVHANHAQEIDGAVGAALARLRQSGVTLLNQAVLLKGVNDSVAALRGLSEALFDNGVLPYYLHLLDRVQGAAHFEVSQEQALCLFHALRRELPGYLVPRLVREEVGGTAKLPLSEVSSPPL